MSRHGRRTARREQPRVLNSPFSNEDDIYEDCRGVPVPLTVFVE